MSDDKRGLAPRPPFWVDQEKGEETEAATVDKLLQGETLLSDLLPRKSKGIRIYVSCPPNELVEERRQFANNVYSHLYDYCWNNYGVECMITDLKLDQTKNWELPENIELCKEEIRRSRQTCTGPSLLIFCNEASSQNVACHLLSSLEQSFKSCYEESERNKSCNDDDDDSSNGSSSSSSSFSDEDFDCDSYLQWILLHNRQAEKQLSAFYSTVFGIEIREGLVMCGDQPLSKQNIVFASNAAQIEKEIVKKVKYESKILKHKNADPANVQRIERYSQGLNCKFVHLPIESGMCMAKYHCPRNGGLCGKDAYMSRNLERQIDACLSGWESDQESNGKRPAEILNHWYYAKQLTQNSVCRDDMQTIFDNYLYVATTWPLAVIGETASGKSTLIALLALSVQQRLQQHIWKDTHVVLHFVGLTPQSSNIREVLFSICSQIIHLTGRNSREVPTDYTELKTFFKKLMRKGPLGASVVVLLDNIEYFYPQKNEEELYEWLPLTLAENVKIIFTSNETLESFCTRINDKVSRYFELGPLSKKESGKIWENWIKAIGPNYHQMNATLQATNNCTKPGIQKILLENIIRFRPIPPSDFVNVETAFNQYLKHIEERHDESFVSKSLSLLAMAAPMGLSEMELHILIKSIFCSVTDSNRNKRWKEKEDIVYRWRCLHKDLNWFLVECIVDGMSVLTLPLGHLLSRIKQRYLTNCGQRQKIENALHRFYDFSFDEQFVNRLQPLYFPVAKKWNVRKFNMTAHVLARSSYHEEFKTRLLYDYNWLVRKLRATSLDDVLKDFSAYTNDAQAHLISEALQMSRSELQNKADFLCFELLGRLLPVRSHFPNIRRLLDQCDQAILKQYHIAPVSQLYMAPGGPLKKAQYQSIKQANMEAMVDMFQTGTGVFAMYRSGFESATGLEVRNLEGDLVWEEPNMPSKKVLLSRDGKYMNVFLSKDFLAIVQSSNGNIHGVVETGLRQSVGRCSACSEHYIAFTSVKGVGPILINIETCTVVHRMEYYTQAMAFSKDEGHFALYTGNRIILFSIPCFERKGTVETEEVPKQLMLSTDGKKCFSLSRTGVVAVSRFDWKRRDSSIQEVFYHVNLQLMSLSAKGDIILFLSSKKLFLCQVQSPNTVTSLEFPAEIFIEKISYFAGAAFSATDDFVVGLRWTYVGVWETRTSSIVRVLKTSDNSPFKKLFVPKTGFEFYTLTNHKLELWDLGLIQSDIQFKPNVFSGAVRDLALSANGQRVICCTYKSPEAKVLDVQTGTVLLCLLHGHRSLNEVTHVEISPDAQFAVTFSNRNYFDNGGEGNTCHFLKECILWDIRTQNPKKLHHFGSCRFVTFPKTSDLLFVIYCHAENKMTNHYSLMISYPAGNQENYIKLPERVEFIRKPCVITSGRSNNKNTFMAAILQKEASSKLAPVPFFSTSLFLIAFGTPEDSFSKTDVKYFEDISLRQIYPEAQTMDRFYDIKTTQDEKILLIFVKNVPEYNLDLENFLELSNTCKTVAAIFDVVTKETLTLIQDLYFTDHFQIPDHFFSQDIFKNVQNIVLPTTLTDLDIKLKQHLVTNGCWSVGLSDDQKYVKLVSLTRKKNEAICVPIHGRAVHVDVAADGHTLAVGCTDGRILLFSLTLSSPQRSEVLTQVERIEAQIPAPEALLKLDISRADVERQNQLCLSAKFRKEKLEEFYRPQSSKKLLANAQSFNEFQLLC